MCGQTIRLAGQMWESSSDGQHRTRSASLLLSSDVAMQHAGLPCHLGHVVMCGFWCARADDVASAWQMAAEKEIKRHGRGQRRFEFAVEVSAGPPNSVFRLTKVTERRTNRQGFFRCSGSPRVMLGKALSFD
jgi:hypothetical protein